MRSSWLIFLGTAALYAFSASPLAFFFPQMAHQSGKREGSRATAGCALVTGRGGEGRGTVESVDVRADSASFRAESTAFTVRPANLPPLSRGWLRFRS